MTDDGLMFNEQDISMEAEMWTNAYIQGDYKKVGYLFADTLDKYSQYRK